MFPRVDIGTLVFKNLDGFPFIDGKITVELEGNRRLIVLGVMTDIEVTGEIQVASISQSGEDWIVEIKGIESARGAAPWRLNIWKLDDLPDLEENAAILLGVFEKEPDHQKLAVLIFETETYKSLTEVKATVISFEA